MLKKSIENSPAARSPTDLTTDSPFGCFFKPPGGQNLITQKWTKINWNHETHYRSECGKLEEFISIRDIMNAEKWISPT